MKNFTLIMGFMALTFCATAQQYAYDDLLLDPIAGNVPHVLSAVRLHQPTAEVPASVTVLDAKFIKATGITNIQDLFRYVPGMLVVPEPFDNSDSVVYHGGPALYPKSMEVLIDGRTAYSSGLAAVSWNLLPVAIEEIQRIEIVRGPNSTTYGTNAFQAVVNIITKHPADTLSQKNINIKMGDNNDHYLQGHIGFDALGAQWKLTAVDKGTDHLSDDTSERVQCESQCPNRRDVSHIKLQNFYEIDTKQSFDMSLLYYQGERGAATYGSTTNTINEDHIEAGVRYYFDPSEKHHIKFSSSIYKYHRDQVQTDDYLPVGQADPDLAELYKINPEAAAQIVFGLSPDAIDFSDPNQLSIFQKLAIKYANPQDFLVPVSATSSAETTEIRTDVELQDTYAITPNLTVLSGIGFRYDKVHSDTYYNGMVHNDSWRFFGNVNWKASDRWSLHTGIMNETSELDSSALSFRTAANYLISPIESIRIVYSEAAKTPDFLEQYVDWTYKLENIETTSPYVGEYFFRSVLAQDKLDTQHIKSLELGYYGQSRSYRSEWDLRIFHEKISDLIYFFPAITSQTSFQNNDINFYGFEWQFSSKINTQNKVRYIGAYTKANATTEEGLTEEELLAAYSPLSQTISLQTEWSNSLNSMLSLFWIKDLGAPSANSDQQVNTHRLDLNVYGTLDNRSIREVSWAVSVQHDFSKDPYVTYGRAYEQSTRFQLELGLNF
jgi:iron complex outermembrane receptor protein